MNFDEQTSSPHEKEALIPPQSGLLDSKQKDYYSFHPEGTPSLRSIFSVVSTMAGAGVLGMPYAMRQGGWFGLLILIIVWIMTNYTGKILIKSMYAKKPRMKLKTYHHLGEAAFGKVGLYMTLGFQNATLLFAGSLFLILAGTNFKSIFDQYHIPHDPLSVKIYIGATAVIVWPLICFLKTMKEISIIAICGMIATSFTVIVIIACCIIDRDRSAVHSWVVPETLPYAFVSFVFAFGGHNVFPTIQDSMRSPKNFNRMFNISYAFILILYLPPCILAYWAFGDKTEEIVLANLTQGVVPLIATIAITLHLLVTIPILSNPLNLWVEEVTKISEQKYEFILRVISRTLIIAVQAGIAIGLPVFGDVMAFIGATCISSTVFFLPSWFYMKLFWKKIPIWEIVWNCLITIVAIVGSSIGLYSAVISLYQDVSHKTLIISSKAFYSIVGGVSAVGIILIFLGLWLLSRSAKKKTVPINGK